MQGEQVHKPEGHSYNLVICLNQLSPHINYKTDFFKSDKNFRRETCRVAYNTVALHTI